MMAEDQNATELWPKCRCEMDARNLVNKPEMKTKNLLFSATHCNVIPFPPNETLLHFKESSDPKIKRIMGGKIFV
jgi:hypothetical protein